MTRSPDVEIGFFGFRGTFTPRREIQPTGAPPATERRRRMKRFDPPTNEEDVGRAPELRSQEDARSPGKSPAVEEVRREGRKEEEHDEGGVVFVDMSEKYRGMGFIIGLGPPWPTCPLCGFLDVKKVFYGPADQLPDPDDYIHGGEEVLARQDLPDPDWYCPDCGHTWKEVS
jgi:rubredoxin